MSISRFPQELSILLSGADIRIKLPGKRHLANPEELIKINFHHPLLSSNYYERYDISKSLEASDLEKELEKKNIPNREAAPYADESKVTIGTDCMEFLNGVRTTPDEHEFLQFMLKSPPVSEETIALSAKHSSILETRSD
jgi:hypothetical protein